MSPCNGFPTSVTSVPISPNVPSGLLASLTDAAGNRTGYGYDGFDRLIERRYPSLVSPGGSSATDFEQFGYDAGGNVISERRRDVHLCL